MSESASSVRATLLGDISLIRADIELLSDRLEALVARVDCLQERLNDLDEDSSYTVVRPSFTSRGYRPAEGTGSSVRSPAEASAGPGLSWAEREAISADIGRYLRRALNGEHRGSSGRARLPQGSRYYIVCRTVSGAVHTNPVLILTQFSEVERLCDQGRGDWGDSVFVGLPSKREELAEEEEGGEEPAGPTLRDNLVFSGGDTESYYTLGRIELPEGLGSCSIIAIAEFDNSVLVAVPASVWHKKLNRRTFHKKGLLKPLQCSVVSAVADDLDLEDDAYSIKVWIGWLAPDLESLVDYGGGAADFPFLNSQDESQLPSARGLVAIASEHFAFMTAESGNGGGRGDGQDRVGRLEQMMEEMQKNMQTLLRGAGPVAKQASVAAGQRVKAPVPKPKGVSETAGGFANLDPQVVFAARAAGVPEEHLVEMENIVRKGGGRMGDLPRPSVRNHRAGADLSESDDEENEIAEGMGTGSGGDESGVARAIVKLTKVCSALAKDRKPKSQDPVESILDAGSGGHGDGSGLGSSRRNAAAFRALKKALRDNPAYIYETIEQHLQADFESIPSRPGLPLGGASIRGWVESRSRIQHYPQHIRWTWAAAGIWDSLIREDYKQARARAALLVAAADQAAIDNGNWLLASVAMLEPPAPFHAFSLHQPPGAHDLQHTVLLDPKWMEVFVSHVKEMDSYQEAKKRLGRPQAALPQAEASDREGSKNKPKPKPKPKGKAPAKKEKEAAAQEEAA
eukprot:Skav221448  [mRNA]  locus=scaffold140:154617:156907:+ [translate_table: standard]